MRFSLSRQKEVKKSVKYRVIYGHKGKYSVIAMCRFFNVSHSGYYDFVHRMDQQDKDEPLRKLIEERRAGRYGQTLGCRTMQLWLEKEKHLHYNYKTVWRVIHKYGILSVCRRRRYYRQSETLHIYPNLLNRDFKAERTN